MLISVVRCLVGADPFWGGMEKGMESASPDSHHELLHLWRSGAVASSLLGGTRVCARSLDYISQLVHERALVL